MGKNSRATYCSTDCKNKGRYLFYPTRYQASMIKGYGITLDEYNSKLKTQKYVCQICKRPERVMNHKKGKPYNLCVDHNHTTGEVRSLLCRRCNLIVGQLENNWDHVQECIDYLKKELKRVKGI